MRSDPVVDVLGADDLRPLRVGYELRARRGEIVVDDTVDRVFEVPRGDRRPVAEPKPLANEERVALPALRDLEARCNLGLQESSSRTFLVRVVVELRRGRVFEPPRSRDVRQLRIDLDRGAGRPDDEDPALPRRRRSGELRRNHQRTAYGQHHE